MHTRVQIGDVAKLLGITPKTIRHYHKIGLLTEAQRSEGGYRLYDTPALFRLHRIRRLQALGLSLRQIQGIVGTSDTDTDPALSTVLHMLLITVRSQIAHLEEQRQRIEQLLAEDSPMTLDAPRETPVLVQRAQQFLSENHITVSAAVWEHEVKLWTALDGFAWPDAEIQRQHQLADYFFAHPDHYHQMVILGEKVAALAEVPRDAPVIETLAAEWAQCVATWQIATDTAAPDLVAPSPFTGMIGEVLLSALSPAQQRFMEKLQELTRGGQQ